MSRSRQRGSMALELVLLTPVLLLTIFLVVAGSRYADARSQVASAAYDAARAATLAGLGDPIANGQAAGQASLREHDVSCRTFSVEIDTSQLHPGGQVSATVRCTAALSDLALPGLPGAKTLAADAVVPVEQYRW